MNKNKIKAAARKALIVADKNYYSWPPEQQEKFRATMNDAAQSRVEVVLLKDLQGIKCSVENAGEIWRERPLSKLDSLNWAKLLTTGIGDDYILLNESMAENISLLNFKTLYDYDYDDHLFQEQANKNEFRNYKARDYYAFLFSRWARLIIDDDFYYATLCSLAGHLIDEVESTGSDYIDQLIPHEYVEGKDNGKQEKGGFRWDMQLEAAGQEKQLDELNSRWHTYMQNQWLVLSKEFLNSAPAVFKTEKNWEGDPHQLFIFNNAEALNQVRWRYFLADCELFKTEFSTVEELEKRETTKAHTFLKENHQDIMENFDPKVVKFRKKMKIVMTPGALDDLAKDDINNDPIE